MYDASLPTRYSSTTTRSSAFPNIFSTMICIHRKGMGFLYGFCRRSTPCPRRGHRFDHDGSPLAANVFHCFLPVIEDFIESRWNAILLSHFFGEGFCFLHLCAFCSHQKPEAPLTRKDRHAPGQGILGSHDPSNRSSPSRQTQVTHSSHGLERDECPAWFGIPAFPGAQYNFEPSGFVPSSKLRRAPCRRCPPPDFIRPLFRPYLQSELKLK